MKKKAVATADAPQAIGPYSQAVISDQHVYCSGQIPLDATTGQLVEGSIEDQVRQVLLNLTAVLEAAGSSLDKVTKTTIFLTDLDSFQRVNAIYSEFFHSPFPARSTIQVSGLPLGAGIEIEAIAIID